MGARRSDSCQRFNFLSNILLARILGIEEFGRYVLAWTIVLFVQGLQFSTVSSAMLSIGPKARGEAARSYFGAIFVHQSIFGAVSAALTLVGCYIAAIFFPEFSLGSIALPLASAILVHANPRFFSSLFFFNRTLQGQLSHRLHSIRRPKYCNIRIDQLVSREHRIGTLAGDCRRGFGIAGRAALHPATEVFPWHDRHRRLAWLAFFKMVDRQHVIVHYFTILFFPLPPAFCWVRLRSEQCEPHSP